MIKNQLNNSSQMGVERLKNGGHACLDSMQTFLYQKNASNIHKKFISSGLHHEVKQNI